MDKKQVHRNNVNAAIIAALTLCITVIMWLLGSISGGVITARAETPVIATEASGGVAGEGAYYEDANPFSEFGNQLDDTERIEVEIYFDSVAFQVHNAIRLGFRKSSELTYIIAFSVEELLSEGYEGLLYVSGSYDKTLLAENGGFHFFGTCDVNDYFDDVTLVFYLSLNLYSKLTDKGSFVPAEERYMRLCFDNFAPLTTPEVPAKEGHHFVGWYLDEECTIPYNGELITSDMQFYAKYEKNEYTVVLDSNGGSKCESVVVEWNTAAQLPTPEREGYNFLGWYMADDTKYEGQAVTENMTLRAKWEIRYYTVTFYVDGEVYKTVEVRHGATFQQVMSSVASLRYFNLLNEDGEKIAKSGKITSAVEVPIGEMTQEEKYATFFGNNLWLVWALVALAGAGIISTVISSVVAYSRR